MLMRPYLDQGYFLHQDPLASGDGHACCGPCTIRGAVCPNCSAPLLQFVNFDLRDPRLGLSTFRARHLPLLFCWRCPLAQEPFAYRLLEDGGVDLIACGIGEPEIDFPYPDYPAAFPAAKFGLVPLTDAQQATVADLNAGAISDQKLVDGLLLDVPRHQIGGEPYLVQPGMGAMVCPKCKVELPLLATIGDDTVDGRGFTGNDYVQVLYFLCANCSVVTAYQTCD
jgi:hypothetical protein